jgi:hypothetical protein
MRERRERQRHGKNELVQQPARDQRKQVDQRRRESYGRTITLIGFHTGSMPDLPVSASLASGACDPFMSSSQQQRDGVGGEFALTRYCSQCGAESLPGSFCPGCGAWTEQVATGVDPRVAGFGIRAVARILDNVVALAVGRRRERLP